MIFEIFVLFAGLALTLIFLGFFGSSPTTAMVGYLMLFLLGTSGLSGGIDVATQENTTTAYSYMSGSGGSGDLSLYVPYTGATDNVDLSQKNITNTCFVNDVHWNTSVSGNTVTWTLII